MLNRWAILGMLLVVLCAYSGAHEVQAEDDQRKPTAPVTTVSAQQNDGGCLNAEDEKKNIHADVNIVNTPQKDIFDKAPVWINLALAIIAFGAACVVGWQSRETRRAAKAGEQAAKAGLEQIKLIKAKERAKLVIQLKPFIPFPSEAHWIAMISGTVSIYGSTEAYIGSSEIYVSTSLDAIDNPLPEWLLGIGLPEVIPAGAAPINFLALVNGDDGPITKGDALSIQKGEKLIYCRARINYRDTFEDAQMVEVRTVHRFVREPRDTEDALTYGRWEKADHDRDGERQNPN
jgi:hypothetical protein